MSDGILDVHWSWFLVRFSSCLAWIEDMNIPSLKTYFLIYTLDETRELSYDTWPQGRVLSSQLGLRWSYRHIFPSKFRVSHVSNISQS